MPAVFLCPWPAPEAVRGEEEEGEAGGLLLCEPLRSHAKNRSRKRKSWKQAQKKVETLAVDTQWPIGSPCF